MSDRNRQIWEWQSRRQSETEKALRRAFQLGQIYWQQAESASLSQNRRSDETRAQFETLLAKTCPEAIPFPKAAASQPPGGGEA